MRIIAGSAGGIPLKVPRHVTRPTTDRVREALFSMLGPHIAGARVLDLFAGSGSLGLEALSRGATQADFIDQNRSACQTLQENLLKTRLNGPTARIHQGDVTTLLPRLRGPFDLIFADPPYQHQPSDPDFATQLLTHPTLPTLLSPSGSLILETKTTKTPPALPPSWTLIKDRAYGETRLLWLQPTA
ncbi:MAG: 16S rRNA (guanine(966)-N(2))-methyltransferase RsmD [Verrucomicrobiales bacterium]|nr:16S rRNA (guanine(966)-N(2))-methyltransferase RsmD [Verrucomicrobiales bacterium]